VDVVHFERYEDKQEVISRLGNVGTQVMVWESA
jgi:hypothetical protein